MQALEAVFYPRAQIKVKTACKPNSKSVYFATARAWGTSGTGLSYPWEGGITVTGRRISGSLPRGFLHITQTCLQCNSAYPVYPDPGETYLCASLDS